MAGTGQPRAARLAALLAALLVTLLLLGAGSAWAQERPRDELGTLQTSQRALAVDREELLRRADRLATEVSGLKRRQAQGASSRLEERRLQELLRRSQVLSDSLDRQSLRLLELERRLAGAEQRRFAALSDSIESLGSRLERQDRTDREALSHLQRLQEERTALEAAALARRERGQGRERDHRQLDVDRLARVLRISPEDTPEEIRERADFLADLAAKWSDDLELLERGLARVRDQRAVRRRLDDFTQELSLFDQTGLANRVVPREPAGREEPAGEGGGIIVTGGFTDRSTDPPDSHEDHGLEGEGAPAAELELFDPGRELWLTQNLDQLSPRELESALKLLESRRDSLRQNSKRLRELERDFRERARKLGQP